MSDHNTSGAAPDGVATPQPRRVWLGYWALVFVIMHTPKPPGVSVNLYGGDKLLHAGAYLVLALLGGWAAKKRRRRQLTLAWGLSWLAIYAAYGAADEWLQGFVGRTPSVWDWTADVGGAIIGLCVSILDKRESRVGDRASQG